MVQPPPALLHNSLGAIPSIPEKIEPSAGEVELSAKLCKLAINEDFDRRRWSASKRQIADPDPPSDLLRPVGEQNAGFPNRLQRLAMPLHTLIWIGPILVDRLVRHSITAPAGFPLGRVGREIAKP